MNVKYMIIRPIVYGSKPKEATSNDQKYKPWKRRKVVKTRSSSSSPL
jgi:hypothetical protein